MALLDDYIAQGASSSGQGYGNAFTAYGAGGGYGNAFTGSGSTNSSFGNAFTGYQPATSGYDNSYSQAAADYGSGGAGANQGLGGSYGGAVSTAGGQWATLDQYNPEISQTAAKYGAPGNLIKSMINNESSGNWARDGRRVVDFGRRMADGTPNYILPFVGITKAAAQAWGLDFDAMVGNRQAQIDGMGKILSGLAQQYGGSYDNAVKAYFGGDSAVNGNWSDENGLASNDYYKKAVANWKALDQQSGYTGGYGDAGGGNIVQNALQYAGVPYIWSHVPGASEDPWKTGWDCSGFTKFLSDKYGDGSLPAGSHQQYADTVQRGLLVQDPNQLQAGDLVFFDTGDDYASNINRASHVGMYIGNGQFIQAANPNAGTIVSNLGDYIKQYGFLGGRKMAWSGGAAGQTQQQTKQPFSSRVLSYLMQA